MDRFGLSRRVALCCVADWQSASSEIVLPQHPDTTMIWLDRVGPGPTIAWTRFDRVGPSLTELDSSSERRSPDRRFFPPSIFVKAHIRSSEALVFGRIQSDRSFDSNFLVGLAWTWGDLRRRGLRGQCISAPSGRKHSDSVGSCLDLGPWSFFGAWRLDAWSFRAAPSPPPTVRQQLTTSVSSVHLITKARRCNSSGGILATFLKIFFRRSKH